MFTKADSRSRSQGQSFCIVGKVLTQGRSSSSKVKANAKGFLPSRFKVKVILLNEMVLIERSHHKEHRELYVYWFIEHS